MFMVRRLLRAGLRTTLPKLQENARSFQGLATPSLPIERSKLSTSEKTSDELKAPMLPENKVRVLDIKVEVDFTCQGCNTINHRIITKKAYEEGVVIVQCDCCKRRRVLVDNKGYFSGKKPDNIFPMFFTSEEYDQLCNDELKRIQQDCD